MSKLIKLQCLVTESREFGDSGLPCIDITFVTKENSEGLKIPTLSTCPTLTYIRFRNFYTHTLRVRQLMSPPESLKTSPRWSTLLELPLMASPHHEDDAQEWFVVHVADFLPGTFHPERLHTLRFVLSQPSGLWKKSALQSIECFEEIHLGVRSAASSSSSPLSPSFFRRQEASDSSNRGGDERIGVSSPSGWFVTEGAESPFVLSSTYNVLSAESGSYRDPSLVVSSLQNRTSELKATIARLRECKKSKLGNPGSTLDFGAGAATLVKIKST